MLEPMRRIRVADRRQRHRHRRRPHVHRAHRVRRGGPPDPDPRSPPRSWTSPASPSSASGRARSATTGRPSRSTRRASTAPRTAAGAFRGVGIPDPGLAPTPPGSTQAFFLWAPLHWDDRCTHFGVFEDANANRWHTDGAVLPVYSSPDDIPGAEDPGTRAARRRRARARLPPGHAPRRARAHRARPRRRPARGHRPRAAHLLPHEGHRLHAPRVGPRHVEGRARVRGGVVEGRRPRPDGVREPAPPAGRARHAAATRSASASSSRSPSAPTPATASRSSSTPPDLPHTKVASLTAYTR